jgi:hypothetical protein
MEASGQLHAPAGLPLRKEALVFIEYEVGWAPELVCRLWRRKKPLTLTGNRTSDIQPISIPNKLLNKLRKNHGPFVYVTALARFKVGAAE